MGRAETDFKQGLRRQALDLVAPILTDPRRKKSAFIIPDRWVIRARTLQHVVAESLQPDESNLEIVINGEMIFVRRLDGTPLDDAEAELIKIQQLITDLVLVEARGWQVAAQPQLEAPIETVPGAVNLEVARTALVGLFSMGTLQDLGYKSTDPDRFLAQANKILYRVHSHIKYSHEFSTEGSDYSFHLNNAYWQIVLKATTLEEYFSDLGIARDEVDVRRGFSLNTLKAVQRLAGALIAKGLLQLNT